MHHDDPSSMISRHRRLLSRSVCELSFFQIALKPLEIRWTPGEIAREHVSRFCASTQNLRDILSRTGRPIFLDCRAPWVLDNIPSQDQIPI